jgi:hypothetical protein
MTEGELQKLFFQSPRDWAEDASLENGCYCNLCVSCQQSFVGYKRRITCKLCATPKIVELPYE